MALQRPQRVGRRSESRSPARCSPSAASIGPASAYTPRPSSATARSARCARRRPATPSSGSSTTARTACCESARSRPPRSARRTSRCSFPTTAAVGHYGVEIQAKRQGKWRTVAQTSYRVAEYRPPEFLVELNAENATKLPGDRFGATVQARYLFGAPMARADRHVDGASGTRVTVGARHSRDGRTGTSARPAPGGRTTPRSRAQVIASGIDTLDARGERALSVTLPATPKGRPARVTLEVGVTDVNRQAVGTTRSTIVHPAEFYVAAKPSGTDYFWKAGTPQSVARARCPTGRPEGDGRSRAGHGRAARMASRAPRA